MSFPEDWDDWDGPPPRMRRPAVRAVITFIAVASFVGVTLLSTCAPRVTRVPASTTTTQPGITA